jgi:FkbM family methyltransferase
MIKLLKDVLMKTFFNKGRLMSIMTGPLKGYKYMVKPDTGFSSLLGRWEKESQLVYLNSLRKGDIAFDLGANFGIHSLLYSSLVGDAGTVYSFEPLPSNVEDLKLHIQANEIKNIKIEEFAVSEKEGSTTFKLASHGGQGSLIGIGKENGTALEVKTISLDAFCKQNKVVPDFVKIDIEGAEGLALQGYKEMVKASYPFLAIDLHNPECDLSVGKFLEENGYEVFRVINVTARKERSYRKPLEKILRLDKPFPHPEGIWGVIWAVHPSRKAQVESFIKENSALPQ